MIITRTPDLAIQMFLDRRTQLMSEAYNDSVAQIERQRRRHVRRERRTARRFHH